MDLPLQARASLWHCLPKYLGRCLFRCLGMTWNAQFVWKQPETDDISIGIKGNYVEVVFVVLSEPRSIAGKQTDRCHSADVPCELPHLRRSLMISCSSHHRASGDRVLRL